MACPSVQLLFLTWLTAVHLGAWRGSAAEALIRTNRSYVLDTWDTEHGLPQNEVTSILQTRDGYLWLGTLSGLARFDGNRFAVFNEGNTPGLTSSRILSLFEDSRSDLWVGTAAGLFRVRQDGVVDVPLATGNPSNRLAAACETPDQAVWLHFADGSLWRYLNGGTNWFSDGTVQPTDYRSVALEQDGPLWIATDQQLLAVDWKAVGQGSALPLLQTVTPGAQFLLPSRTGGCWRLNGRVQKWRANQDRPELDFGWYPWGYGLVTVRLTTACEDLDGNLIVGTRGGGLYWFTSEGEVTHISTEENGLSNNYILSLHVDRQGDVWVGTDGGGLNRIKKPLFRVLEPSQDRVVQSIAEDSAGGLWLGYNGLPLTYWKDGQAQTFPSEARTAFVDRQQRVWVGTHGAGLLQVQADARRQLKLRPVPGYPSSLSSVTAIHQDRAGQLWVGTQTGLARWDETSWTTYTTREGLPANVVQAIADDAEGNTWLGFDSGGLCQWRHGQVLATFRKSADGLPSDNVSSLYADSDGVLWVATDGGGLARWQRGQWTRYTRNEGLASNSIGYVLEDHQGYLWIGSNAGLMRASKNALNDFAAGRTNSFGCRVYGKPDGLPVRECSSGTQPGPCRARDGSLWFPTIKGVAVVDPAQLKPNLNPPPVRIEAVLIDGRPQSGNTLRSRLPDFIVVPAGNEHIEVQYSSLSFAAPERARYRYRLEGYQNDWTEAGSATVAHYHRLPPADYRFRVIACNEDGVWNQVGATLGLVILPPFWRTWWFMTTTAIVLLGSVAGIVHYLSTQKLQRQVLQLKQQEALEKERARIARDIHDQLGASLTQVALLGELAEGDKDHPAEVEAHARQISQTARDTTRVLDEIVWAVNPANDTLEGLMTYVTKYTQEYLTVAGLHYRLEIPEHLPTLSIPPEVRHNVFLGCKEAVTNVVRHAHATSVWVRLKLEGTAFVLEIQDNGRGLSERERVAAQSRNGLRNMQKRMEEVGGHFRFAPANEGGTLVQFTVPLIGPRTG